MGFMRKEKGIKRLLAVTLALALTVPAGFGLVVPRVGAADGDSLTLKVGDEGSANFTEAGEINWQVTEASNDTATPVKQIQIEAEFSDPGADKPREITVNVPRGLTITEYSAATSAAIKLVQDAAIFTVSESDGTAVALPALTTADDTVALPALTTADDTITPPAFTAADDTDWPEQRIAGYSEFDETSVTPPAFAAAGAAERTTRESTGYTSLFEESYEETCSLEDGTLVYSFDSLCQGAVLTVALQIDEALLSHDETKPALDPITVDMVSGDWSERKELAVTVTEGDGAADDEEAPFAIMPMAIDTNGFSSNLADFLTEVVIKELNGTPINDGDAVHTGEKYKLQFRFDEVADDYGGGIPKQFEYNDEVLTYKLPDNVKMLAAYNNVPIPGSTGLTIGYSNVDLEGNVTVWFGNFLLDGTETEDGTNYIDTALGTFFTLELEATFVAGSGGTVAAIDFGNNVLINLTVDDEPHLTVEKTAKSYDHENRKIDYTVVVTAHTYDGKPITGITLTDEMLINASNWGNSQGNPSGMLSIVEGSVLVNENSVSPTRLDNTNNGKAYGGRYKIEVGSLANGKSATVTYSVQADALFDHAYNRSSSNEYTHSNIVTASGTHNSKTLSDTDDADGSFSVTHLEKWGTLNDTDRDGIADQGESIEWFAYIGDGPDLRGATITDSLGNYLTMPSQGSIQVRLFSSTEMDENSYIGTLTPQIDSNNKFTVTVPTTLQAPMTNQAVRRVTISYTSAIAGESASYDNTVSVKYPGKDFEFSYKASVKNKGPGNAEKTGVLLENGDGGIRYTISVKIPKEYYGSPCWIQDVLYFAPSTWDTIDNKPLKNDMTVTITTEDGTIIDDYTWDVLYGDDPNFPFVKSSSTWSLVFNVPRIKGTQDPDWTRGTNAQWKINKDSVVTVTYTIPPDAKVRDGEYAGKTLAEVWNYGFVVNEVYIGEDEAASYLCKPIKKSGKKTYNYSSSGSQWRTEGSNNYEDTTFYETKNAKGFSYTVELNPYPDDAPFDLAPAGTPPTFSDSFDPRLRLDTGSVQVMKASGRLYTVSEGSLKTDTPGEFSFNFSDNYTYDPESKYYVTYRLLFRDDADIKPGVTKFPNKATIGITHNDGIITYSDDEEIVYGKPIVEKEMTKDTASNRIVDVEITVNLNKTKLALGDASKITVIDKMNDNLIFLDTSRLGFTVTNADSNASVDYGDLIYDPVENTVTFYDLPDLTKIIIKYKALIKGEQGETVDILNQVEIYGYSKIEAEVKDEFQISTLNVSTGNTNAMFYLYKTDKQTDEPLQGAGFALYKNARYDGYENTPAPDGIDIQKKITVDDMEFYYIMWNETNDSGLATFADPAIVIDRTYLLVEKKTPTGYVEPSGPGDYLFFYIPDDDKPASTDLQKVENGGFYYVTNEADPAAAGGPRFPETGGAGAAPYTVAGAGILLLVLSAAWLRAGRRHRFFDSA
jgi:hypothetical protein